MVKIEVEEQAAEMISKLRAQAKARQIPFDQYLRALAESGSSAAQADARSLGDVERDLDELTEGSERLPVLPADFSREDIYGDHD